MRILKQLVTMVGTLVVMALIATLVAPKGVHALVATLVRDVDNPGRATNVFLYCKAVTPDSFGCFMPTIGNPTINYQVPTGQRLVIEQLEADCLTQSGTVSPTSFQFQVNGNYYFHPIVLTSLGLNAFGYTEYATNQAVRYYVDPGSLIGFAAHSADTTSGTECTAGVNGYLISYP
jgi:hypothetical protein